MQRIIRLCLVFALLLLLFSCGDDNNRRDSLESEIQTLVATVCGETGTPGAAVHVRTAERGDYSVAWGRSDLDTMTPLAPQQPFRIGSLTKSFTGAAVLKLAEKGWIELDAPVSEYLVLDYPPLDQISVRQLLNMSSGLPPYLTLEFILEEVLIYPQRAYAPEELLSRAFAEPELLFAPGEGYFYTNTSYVLLGLLIEEVSGQRYQDYLEAQFFAPLGLQNTHVALDDAMSADLVRGYYDYDEDGRYEDWTAMHMSYVWSAGSIISTARDIAVWMEAMAGDTLFSEPFRSNLYSGQTIVEGVVYTTGIVVEEDFGIGHNGTVIGYHADAWHDPRTGATVAVLSNTNAPLLDDERDPTREIATGVLELLRE